MPTASLRIAPACVSSPPVVYLKKEQEVVQDVPAAGGIFNGSFTSLSGYIIANRIVF